MWLRALDLAKDLGLIPSMHTVPHNQVPGSHVMHTPTCNQNTYTHKNMTNLNFFKFNFSGLGDTPQREHLPPVSKSLGSIPASF